MLVTSEVLMLRLTIFAFSAIVFGQGLECEVASIKPADPNATGGQLQSMLGGGIRARNFPLKNLITLAYGVRDFQLSGGPNWLATERYDIVAKADRTASDGPEDFGSMTDEQRKIASGANR